MSLTRRTFFLTGGALAAHAAPPSDQIALGIIGSGSRGTFVMSVFQKDPAVRVAAICDVYEPNLERAAAQASGLPATNRRPTAIIRSCWPIADVEAVLIATPEHWHYQMVLDALAAGKDIYVEKPLCHTPEQGARLVDAEAGTKRIIQVGMQRRSYDLYQEGREIVGSGKLGTVRMVRSWWLNNYLGGGVATKLDGPLDWEQWQGPAPHRPFDANRFRQWRFYSDYAGGILADQGAHVFDGIHMLMGAGYPAGRERLRRQAPQARRRSARIGGRHRRIPGGFHRRLLHQLRGHAVPAPQRPVQPVGRRPRPHGHRPRRPEGLSEGRGGRARHHQKSEKGFGWATDLHVQNFLECVRTRRPPTAPMKLAFQAALVVQMANLSLKQGRRVQWNAAAGKVV